MAITADQASFQREIRGFALEHVAPRASETDRGSAFPQDIIDRLFERGYMAIPFSEEVGGLGLDTLRYAMAVEEISRVCGSTGITLAAHVSLGTAPIYEFGNPEQKAKYLPGLTRGGRLGAFGLTEPGAGSDAGATKTVGRREGEYFIVNGAKRFITSATHAATAVCTVVTTPGRGVHGISNFIFERGMAGFGAARKEDKLGLRGSDTAEIIIEDCRIHKDQMLGRENEGFKQFMKILDGGRISIAAMALGLAQGALDEALRFAVTQHHLGSPLANRQSVAFKLADMATRIQAVRLLVYEAAQMKDAGQPYSQLSAMAKLLAGEVGTWAAHEAMSLMGPEGLERGTYGAERIWRDVRLCEIGEGTNEVQRLVISRGLIKEAQR